MKTLQFNVYSDPGHAWVKVSRKLLVKLGIADKITPYSYQRGDAVYLEEDCDLSTLLGALKARNITPKFKEFNTNKTSKIRSYESYSYVAPAKKTVKNLMTGKDIEIDADTPWCCNPASETFWSM